MECFYDGLANVGACAGPVTPGVRSWLSDLVSVNSEVGCCTRHRAAAETRASAADRPLAGVMERSGIDVLADEAGEESAFERTEAVAWA